MRWIDAAGLSRRAARRPRAGLSVGTSGAFGAERNTPGAFDYYVLVLTWMPSYCRDEGKRRKDRQCDVTKPHAFLLHGLWPQHEVGWPKDCPTHKRPWVPESVIAEMRDIMPSKNLVIHEYRAHGTCSGLEPAQYFAAARVLYERVSVPPRFLEADSGLLASPKRWSAHSSTPIPGSSRK